MWFCGFQALRQGLARLLILTPYYEMLGSFVSLADCRDSKTNKFATEKLPCNYELNYSVAAQNAKK